MLYLWLYLIGCRGEQKEPDEPLSFDTASPYEVITTCDSVDLASVDMGTVTLDQYTLDVAEQSLSISKGEEVVFESSKWLSFQTTLRNVTEYQGSFTIDHTPLNVCGAFVATSVSASTTTMQIEGHFEACVDTVATVQVCLGESERLLLSIGVDGELEGTPQIQLRKTAAENSTIFGLGEQFPHDTINLKGRRISVLSEEGGVGRGHPEVTPLINQFSNGSGGDENSTYFAMPFYMSPSRDGNTVQGFFLQDTDYVEFAFDSTETLVEIDSDSLTAEFIVEDSALDVLTSFTEYAGRMPAPPDWVDNGAIVALARPLEEGRSYVDSLLDYDAKISGVWNQTWSGVNRTFIGEQVLWNWVQGTYDHPDWPNWVEGLNNDNIEVLCYINPMFLDVTGHESNPSRNLYQEGVEGGYFVRDESGGVLKLPVTAFEVALLDLTNPEARVWMRDVIREEMVEKAGCGGWMVDFAEALPFEAELFDGTHADTYHNQYPVDWMKLNRTAIRESGLTGEILTYNRAGYTQTPRHSLMVWEGDQLTTWDRYDGFRSAIRGLINGGLSGITLNHSDIGGYTSIMQLGDGYSREKQLFMRWAEMSAFTSLMRTHEGNQPTANVQVYSRDSVMAHFARMTKIYTGLTTYRRDLFEQAETLGYPVVRHLWLHYSTDSNVFQHELQFLMGEDILVAPHLENCLISTCTFEQSVYLPTNTGSIERWVHLWTGEVHDGGQEVRIEAPLGYPAVFYRQSADDIEAILESLRSEGLDIHP